MDVLASAFLVLSLPILLLGATRLLLFPLALLFEVRRRPVRPAAEQVLVSIVVPAYDEARVVANCVRSILADEHPRKQVILVDDGSRDGTLDVLRRFADEPGVVVVSKPNGGKASALNAGLAHAQGEFVLFVDADGIFTTGTVRRMLEAFDRPSVGAVCGNDEPVNLDRAQTVLLALLTHVGTGFVRRALAVAHCLPIVSGNLGAFRRDVVEELGGFDETTLGEDLELTWRVHRAGYRVAFAPRAVVYAEVPSTVRALWRQRVRWTRGLVQTTRLHVRMLGNPRYGAFGLYLPVNVAAMLLVPVLQVAVVVMLPLLVADGRSPIGSSAMAVLGWLGLLLGLAATVFAIVLDRAWTDLRHLWVVPLWPLYSLLMSVVVCWALLLELVGARARWNKLERTGVVSRDAAVSLS